MSAMTVTIAVRCDLRLKSYVRRLRNILTPQLKEIRAERSPWLLNHLKHNGGDVRNFVDENKFMVDGLELPELLERKGSKPSKVPAVIHRRKKLYLLWFLE